MAHFVQVDVDLSGVESLSRSEMNAAFKAAFLAVGKRWRRRYLPLHFGNRAERRYYYTPRKWEYEGRKLKYLNHTRPLEYTGEGRREATYRENIIATRDKCTVRLPRKFNFRGKGSRVKMADEIRRVLVSERAELAEFFVFVLEKELRRRGARSATASLASSLAAAA